MSKENPESMLERIERLTVERENHIREVASKSKEVEDFLVKINEGMELVIEELFNEEQDVEIESIESWDDKTLDTILTLKRMEKLAVEYMNVQSDVYHIAKEAKEKEGVLSHHISEEYYKGMLAAYNHIDLIFKYRDPYQKLQEEYYEEEVYD